MKKIGFDGIFKLRAMQQELVEQILSWKHSLLNIIINKFLFDF